MNYKTLLNILVVQIDALKDMESTEDKLETLNEITRTATVLHQAVYDNDPVKAYDVLVDSGIAKPWLCFDCNHPIRGNDDAGVCIQCGGMNVRR